jgi:outer membrane lipoprotein-sorting protein
MMLPHGETKIPIAPVALLGNFLVGALAVRGSALRGFALRSFALGAFVLGTFVGGCVHAPPVARPYPAPTPEALTAALAARQQAVGAMSARARATSWLGGERVRATVNMLVERDGHLRFEAQVSLQGTVATLATDGVTFALLDARKNELSRGPACPANVASLIRIPLAPAEVAAILLGDARLPDPANIDGAPLVSWDAHLGADVLTVRDRAGGSLQLFFQGEGAARQLIAVSRLGADGAPLWRTSYKDFETVAGQHLPRTILFAERNASFDDGVEIRFKDRALDSTAPAGAFTLAPPPGVTVRDVGCSGGP